MQYIYYISIYIKLYKSLLNFFSLFCSKPVN